jgi:hypothetical protein
MRTKTGSAELNVQNLVKSCTSERRIANRKLFDKTTGNNHPQEVCW